MLSYIKTKPYEVVLWVFVLMVGLWIFGLLGRAMIIDTGVPPWYVTVVGLWISSVFVALLLGIAKTPKEAFWIGTAIATVIVMMTVLGYFFIEILLR